MPGAYEGFEGRVGRTVAGSDPWWPPRPTPPAGAPNVVVMLVDDLGFADLGCYGSEIATPNLDALASSGLRFTNFHVTPMCSPTRAALLTGCNSHAVGVGHVAHSDAGFPGYAMELATDAATAAEIFRDNGYATLMVGKWHLAKDSDCSDAGPRHSWPCQRGFDRFYGFLDGFTNLHHPHRLVEDNSPVEVDDYPEGYYLTDDLTDRAISMVRSVKANNPSVPFFLYFAHGAVHAPLQAKAGDIARYRDRYHGGWDRLRDERFARMKELGILAPDVQLAPRNSEPGNDVLPWADLPSHEQELFARYMAVYAGMVDNIDQMFGRLRGALDELGELDNTIILFTSDNGASREGEAEGTTAYFVHLGDGSDTTSDHRRLEDIGGPQTTPHYPRGWAMASNTPFRLYKINTHQGGHSVPMILSWPTRITEGGAFRRQFAHVTDVLPTLLDLVGLHAPTTRAGQELRSMAGTSFAPVLVDAEAAPTHTEQLYEMIGHRGYYRDGWEAVTLHPPMTPFSEDEWELYDLTRDRTELRDLAAEQPERLRELADAWERAAWDNQVYPLDEGSFLKFVQRPEDRIGPLRDAVTIAPGTPTLERWRSALLVSKATVITVRLTYVAGDEGVLVAHGDQGGGYVLYVEHDRLAFAHNDGRGATEAVDGGPLAAGARAVEVRFGAGRGNTWTIDLAVDGAVVGRGEGFAVLGPMAPFEGIDIGIDRRSPVSWRLYQQHGPFPFTGRIESVRYDPGEAAKDVSGLVAYLREVGARFE